MKQTKSLQTRRSSPYNDFSGTSFEYANVLVFIAYMSVYPRQAIEPLHVGILR